MLPSERNVFPFLLNEAQVAAPTAKWKVPRDGGGESLPILLHSSLNTCRLTLSDTLWNKRLLWAALGKSPSLTFLVRKTVFWVLNDWLLNTLWEPHYCVRVRPAFNRIVCKRSTLEFYRQRCIAFEMCSTPKHCGNSTTFSQVEMS